MFFVSDDNEGTEEEFATEDELTAHLDFFARELLEDGRDIERYFDTYISIIKGERIKPNIKVNFSITLG